VSPQIKFSKINHGIDHERFIVTFIIDTTIYPHEKWTKNNHPANGSDQRATSKM